MLQLKNKWRLRGNHDWIFVWLSNGDQIIWERLQFPLGSPKHSQVRRKSEHVAWAAMTASHTLLSVAQEKGFLAKTSLWAELTKDAPIYSRDFTMVLFGSLSLGFVEQFVIRRLLGLLGPERPILE